MAVYTDVTDDALAAFLADYDIGTMVAFRGVAEGVENSNYSLRTTGGDFILTLYEKRVDPDDLPWFLGLMEHLAARGLVCPQPVHAKDGSALRHLCGKYAAITTFLPGVWPRRVRQEHCGPVGATLAKLHLAGTDFPPSRPNALGPQAWAPLLERCRGRINEVQAGLADQLDHAMAAILPAWPRFPSRRPYPCRHVPRQRFLPRWQTVGRDRFLLRRHRPDGLRHRCLPQRLVL